MLQQCVDLQAVLVGYNSLANSFGPFLRGFGQALEKGRVLFLVTTSTLNTISTGICGVACPLPVTRVDKPLTISNNMIATFLADIANKCIVLAKKSYINPCIDAINGQKVPHSTVSLT